MSKDTPEVGDVWGNAFEAYYIEAIDILGDKNKKMVRAAKRVNDKYVVQRQYFQENFIEDYRYLGKSKANIDDLFKTGRMINIGKLVEFFDKGWVAYNKVGGWKYYRYSGIRAEMKCEGGMWICYKIYEADAFNPQREWQHFGVELDSIFTIEKPLVKPENSLIKVGYWED